MQKFALIFTTLVTILGCASKMQGNRTEVTKSEGETLYKLDINKDGKTDCLWSQNVRDPKSPVTLWRKDDLNFDGAYDIEQHYAAGKLLYEKMDLDFDGNYDAFNYYENGIIARSEYALTHDKRIDMWIFYKDGKPIKKEVDTQKNGNPDYFEFFKDAKIDRIGRDFDGDGIIDRWE